MQKILVFLVILTILSGHRCGRSNEGHTYPEVIELHNGMLEKGKAEKHAGQVQFAAFKQFCGETTAEKKRAIAKANEMIEVLEADI